MSVETRNETRDRIQDMILSNPEMTPKAISEALGLHVDHVRRTLKQIRAQVETEDPEAKESVSSGGRPPIVLVPLSDIRPDLTYQVREGMNVPVVKTYHTLYSEGYDFEDPLELFRDEGVLKPWDGMHRYFAALEAGLRDLPCRIWDYTPREALLAAIRKNSRHGLAFSNLDKRKVAEILLRDPDWSDKPNREIARFMGVSHPFIAIMKAEVLGEIEIPEGLSDGPEPPEDEPWGEEPGAPEDDPSVDHRRAPAPETNGHVEVESVTTPEAEEVEEVESVTTPDSSQPVHAPPLSDDEWLKQFPLAHDLRGPAFQTFRADALSYRRWADSEEARAALRVANRLLDERTLGRPRGMFQSRLRWFFALTNHPKDWKRCLNCSWTGQVETGTCDRCHGWGYTNG